MLHVRVPRMHELCVLCVFALFNFVFFLCLCYMYVYAWKNKLCSYVRRTARARAKTHTTHITQSWRAVVAVVADNDNVHKVFELSFTSFTRTTTTRKMPPPPGNAPGRTQSRAAANESGDRIVWAAACGADIGFGNGKRASRCGPKRVARRRAPACCMDGLCAEFY